MNVPLVCISMNVCLFDVQTVTKKLYIQKIVFFENFFRINSMLLLLFSYLLRQTLKLLIKLYLIGGQEAEIHTDHCLKELK